MKFLEIKLEDIEPTYTQETNPNRMSDADFSSLVALMREEGSVQTVLVRPKPPAKKGGKPTGKYLLTDGHHRYWAAQQLGIAKLPCLIADKMSTPKAHAIGIGINNLRGSVNLSAASDLMTSIMEETGWTVPQMALLTGFSTADIEAIAKQTGEDLEEILEEVGEAAGGDEEIHIDGATKPFVLEITFTKKEDYKLAKRKLKKAAGKGGDLAAGLMAVLGEEESE